ncbi:MAG: peptidoglycan-binding domain-containing protein [Bacteroidota bacterium]
MKRLFYLVMIISLPLITFFQFDRYRRFHPPTEYAHPIHQDIDYGYHDPAVVLEYLTAAQQTGTYARHLWREHRLDVKSVDPKAAEFQPEIATYQQYVATTQFLEKRLLQSAQWKAAGKKNAEIQALENGSQNERQQAYEQWTNNPVLARVGDQGPIVYEIQRRLQALAYELPLDGIYRSETQRDVQAFQTKQQLFPSGIVDKQTFLRLLNQ